MDLANFSEAGAMVSDWAGPAIADGGVLAITAMPHPAAVVAVLTVGVLALLRRHR